MQRQMNYLKCHLDFFFLFLFLFISLFPYVLKFLLLWLTS